MPQYLYKPKGITCPCKTYLTHLYTHIFSDLLHKAILSYAQGYWFNFCCQSIALEDWSRSSESRYSDKMTSLVARGSSQMSPSVSVQEKGSRNKRKFRADPPLGDPDKIIPLPQQESLSYEFSAEKLETSPAHGQNLSEGSSVSQDHCDGLKLDLGLSSPVASYEDVLIQPTEEPETEEFHDADWSDLTETQLEELVMSNLDTIFKSAIKKIVACGYTEDVASKAVLRSAICYGCKDTVSNIVDNTLAFLRNGQEIDPSREHYFEDLVQLEKYILAELVCVLREVRPYFSTGDAMWCLLICDMNVSHACAMDSDPLINFGIDSIADGCSSVQSEPQSKIEANGRELNLPRPCKSIPSGSCNSQSEESFLAVNSGANKLKTSQTLGVLSEKDGANAGCDYVDKSSNTAGTSQPPAMEEKFGVFRRVHSRKEYVFRQKAFHLEKSYRTYGSKGSSRGSKLSGLSGLILDKKLKSVSETTTINLKSASLKISKAMGVDVSQDNLNANFSSIDGSSNPTAFSLDSLGTASQSSSTLSSVHATATVPAPSVPIASSSTTDTDLSLSLSSQNKSSKTDTCCNNLVANSIGMGIPNDKSLGQWIPQDKKDEMILKLVPRVRELQNQLQEWTEWANQKVMQAARRLSKDKADLKTLRQEKDEVERLKKEKQALEENTMKKLSEMENALCKASGQVERANAAVRRLEVENAALRREMEAAKLRAAESATSCQEVSRREKKTQMKVQSWEKQKSMIQEELITEKRKLAQLQQELEQAKVVQEQAEARWQQAAKEKDELLLQASSIRKEREQIEESAKSKEDMIKVKAQQNLQRHRDEIQKLEKEIVQLRLKTDSSKIAALRRGIDGSYASSCLDIQNGTAPEEESRSTLISELVTNLSDLSLIGDVKRERECVMCLSEEISVVFLPCAHQVVCTTCNELHEKQGMQDCPSCRSPIQRRISVRYSRA